MTAQDDTLAAQLAPYRATPGIVAALLVSSDGFVVASDVDAGIDPVAIAAQVAGVINLGAVFASELGQPKLNLLALDFDTLNAVIAPFDSELMLVLVGKPEALTFDLRLNKPGA